MAKGMRDENDQDTGGCIPDLTFSGAGGESDADGQYDSRRGQKHPRKAESPTRPQSLRIKVLHCLMEDDELNSLAMSKKLGLHQSSISHVIRDMIEERLIIKTARGYGLTNMGRVYIHYIDNFEEILGSLNSHREFIIDHDLSSIPVSHLAMIGLVLRGRDSMPANSLKPYRKKEFLHDQLKRSGRISAIISTLVPEQITAALEAAKSGARIKAILSPEVMSSLQRDFVGIFEETSRCESIEIYVHDDVRISFAIADSILFLGLHRLDGSYDSDNLMICDDEASLIWAEAVFRHFLKGAKRENSLLR
ncbi:MAG: DUF1724 domain-containing protein [Methanothrix sp.]|nr:DUF1724 domain-containing protein [Methanothrix sp.]